LGRLELDSSPTPAAGVACWATLGAGLGPRAAAAPSTSPTASVPMTAMVPARRMVRLPPGAVARRPSLRANRTTPATVAIAAAATTAVSGAGQASAGARLAALSALSWVVPSLAVAVAEPPPRLVPLGTAAPVESLPVAPRTSEPECGRAT